MAIPFSLGQQRPNLTAEEATGMPSFGEALHRGIMNFGQQQESIATPKILAEKILGMHLQNKIQKAAAEYAMKNQQAALESTMASTGLTNENSYKQKILNEFLPQREPAEIDEIKARRDYYKQGGPGRGVGSSNYSQYINGITADNPDLDENQVREAANVLAQGGNQLKDGTILNPMTIGTKIAFDNAIKSTTTANQINTLNNANQADAELKIFSKEATDLRKPYGTTYLGKSPQQIVDSFKNDDESQTRLGKLIAANMVQFETAQVQNRIAGGAPGITSINQLMDEGQQHIGLYGPRLSGKAREVALAEYNRIIEKGLDARNKAGFGAGNLYQRMHKELNNNPQSQKSTDQFVNQMSKQLIPMVPEATPENIKHTAKEMGITVEEVVQRLIKKAKNKKGA